MQGPSKKLMQNYICFFAAVCVYATIALQSVISMYFRKRDFGTQVSPACRARLWLCPLIFYSVWSSGVIASIVACVGQIRIIITVKTLSGSPLAFQLVS